MAKDAKNTGKGKTNNVKDAKNTGKGKAKEVAAVEVEKTAVTTEDIVKLMAAKVEGGSQKQAREYLTALKEVCSETLKDGNKIQLTGFFSAQPIYRSARTANDISTKKPMQVPESVGVSIKAGALLKTATVGLNPADYKKEEKDEE